MRKSFQDWHDVQITRTGHCLPLQSAQDTFSAVMHSLSHAFLVLRDKTNEDGFANRFLLLLVRPKQHRIGEHHGWPCMHLQQCTSAQCAWKYDMHACMNACIPETFCMREGPHSSSDTEAWHC